MLWTEIDRGTYQRTIEKDEEFIKLVGDSGHSLSREHWAINTLAVFESRGTFAQISF